MVGATVKRTPGVKQTATLTASISPSSGGGGGVLWRGGEDPCSAPATTYSTARQYLFKGRCRENRCKRARWRSGLVHAALCCWGLVQARVSKVYLETAKNSIAPHNDALNDVRRLAGLENSTNQAALVQSYGCTARDTRSRLRTLREPRCT